MHKPKHVNVDYIDGTNEPTIHICVPLYNRGNFLRLFVAKLDFLLREERITNVRLVLADFGSTDIHIHSVFEGTELENKYEVRTIEGTFSRAKGLQVAADSPLIAPEDIVFLCDIDLDFPGEFLHKIRKYAVRGKQMYLPICCHQHANGKTKLPMLDRGASGILACYKEDYDRCGGYHHSSYLEKTTWGREDTFLATRLLEAGLQYFRPLEQKVISLWHPRTEGHWYQTCKYKYLLRLQ